jgi:hypothetical protein
MLADWLIAIYCIALVYLLILGMNESRYQGSWHATGTRSHQPTKTDSPKQASPKNNTNQAYPYPKHAATLKPQSTPVKPTKNQNTPDTGPEKLKWQSEPPHYSELQITIVDQNGNVKNRTGLVTKLLISGKNTKTSLRVHNAN